MIKDNQKISCVVPFYNELERLPGVLKVLLEVKNLDEIVCVDDGSEDGAYEKVKAEFPEVRFFRLLKNQGKSAAVREGVRKAKFANIMLFDADLQNLDFEEVERGIEIYRRKNLDMLIFKRANLGPFLRAVRNDVLVSGERIVRRDDLEGILDESFDWSLEIDLNEAMMGAGRKVAYFSYSGTNTHKVFKWGFLRGALLEFKCFRSQVAGAGFRNWVKHYRYFAKDEVS